MSAAKGFVAALDQDVVLPFVLAYCGRWKLRVDNIERADDIWWWGYVEGGAVRAVMGIQQIEEKSLHVWGWLGDGSNSDAERRGLARLRKIVDRLPFDVSGTILVENGAALRHAMKLGWKFIRLKTADGRASFVLGRKQRGHAA